MVEQQSNQLGFVQVVTGDGKGKTTSTLGLALRAIGQGFKVYMIQFLKSGDTGELFSIKKYLPNMTVIQFGMEALKEKQSKMFEYDGGQGELIPVGPKTGKYYYFPPDDKEREPCRRALEHAKTIISSGEHDLVILDEINCAIQKKLITVEEVIEMLDLKPKNVEVILSGRDAPQQLIDRADYVNEVKRIKHPYDRGILARRGIEY